jgi:nucleotide-binding universal stress UspA family protein
MGPTKSVATKILVPVDGSENSKRALMQAAKIAGKDGAQITIVHVIDMPPTVYVESQKLLDQLLEQYRRESARVLDEYEDIAKKEGVDAKSAILEGAAAESIVDYADRHGFDMIVMGSRGLGKIKGAFLGSVSSKVLQHAKCSVLIVK